MNTLMVIVAVSIVPIVLAILLRVSGVFMFSSVAIGYLLVLFVGDDAGLVLGMVVKTSNINMIAQFILLILPVVVTILFLKKTIPKTKVLLHIPLQVASGLALVVLGLPLLDSGTQQKIFSNHYGGLLREYQDIIIVVGAIGTLLIMWLTYSSKGDKKHKKHT